MQWSGSTSPGSASSGPVTNDGQNSSAEYSDACPHAGPALSKFLKRPEVWVETFDTSSVRAPKAGRLLAAVEHLLPQNGTMFHNVTLLSG
jgi:hypothetical protein